LKEVKEEILKIAHSIKHETMDEIATGSSRIIGQDKNALITLKAPLEITQKQPMAMSKFWFAHRQLPTPSGHTIPITDCLVPYGKRTSAQMNQLTLPITSRHYQIIADIKNNNIWIPIGRFRPVGQICILKHDNVHKQPQLRKS
jgi:hypothetical protein